MIRSTALLGALVLAALGVTAPALATAEPLGDCTVSTGVIVAVDFAHWGGPLLRSCGSTPTTAYTLLNQGGWHTTGTEHDGPGFICRIGYAGYDGGTEYPTLAQEPCVLTPPATAYWAFWYANPGQSGWTYSQAGAMSTTAEPGSVELWVFGGTSSGGASGSAVPSVSPDSLRARNSAPVSTVKKTAGPQATTAPPRDTTSASAAAAPVTAPTQPSPAASATPSRQPRIVDAPPATASAPASHGSAAPAIIALVIVLALTAAGIAAVLRRPRRGQ